MTSNVSASFVITFAWAFAITVAIAAATGWYAAKNLKKAEGEKIEKTD